MILGVLGDADHGKRLAFFFWIVDLKLPAQRILAMKEMLHHRLINDSDSRRCQRVLRADWSAEQYGNTSDTEIIRPNFVFVRITALALVRCKAGNDQLVIRLRSA